MPVCENSVLHETGLGIAALGGSVTYNTLEFTPVKFSLAL